MYDYVIVGGGSAGCVLANRLTADPNCKVCLLEAGPPDDSFLFRIPTGLLLLMRSKKYNWQYKTIPQKNCDNRSLYWPRGKTLGGSSSMNAMCYTMGHPSIYDQWAQLGNVGWSYQDLQPYIQKMKNTLTISKPRHLNTLTHVFVQAGKQLGIKFSEDLDNTDDETIGYYRVTQINGERCSNARAYLKPIRTRPNLTVITDALATKILFEDKRATGICYLQKGIEKKVMADREILLCAGAIGSPQLLMLSGIGDAKDLQQLNIKVVHDLPGVGKNLQDHVDIHIYDLEKTHHSIILNPKAGWRFIVALFQYYFKKQGELTTNYAEGGAFLKSDPSQPKPDLQCHFLPTSETRHAQSLKSVINFYGYTLKTAVLDPKSRGQIKLKSNNPRDVPLIDPNYFSEQQDLEKSIKGFKRARLLLNQAAFADHKLKEQEPNEDIKSDVLIREYIRAHAETIYHPVGTCKMGNDPLAVVDPSLRVHGVLGLRVVDASIMPIITSANTNAPTTVIAEKAADLIIQSFEKS